MKPLNLCIYCDHWQNGGVESYLMNQLQHWNLSQIHCTLLTADKTTDIYDVELKSMGVRHDILLKEVYDSPIRRILKTFVAIKQYFQENTFDTLYLNLSNSVTMRYAKYAKKSGIPRRIVHSHCGGIQPGPTWWIKMAAHDLSRRAASGWATDWWACSDKAAEFLFPPSVLAGVQYIPNAIDTERFCFNQKEREEMRIRFSLRPEEQIIGTIGRCTPQKNQRFLLDVFAELLPDQPDVRLLLVGDGPLRAELEEQADMLGIAEKCIFYGFVDDVVPLYCAMDVFCLPSVLEGNPVSAIEAQSMGLPCLLSDAVTGQAQLADSTERLPITQTQVWVSAIRRCLQQIPSRSEGAAVVKWKGYDIVQNAQHVQQLLMANVAVGVE